MHKSILKNKNNSNFEIEKILIKYHVYNLNEMIKMKTEHLITQMDISNTKHLLKIYQTKSRETIIEQKIISKSNKNVTFAQ